MDNPHVCTDWIKVQGTGPTSTPILGNILWGIVLFLWAWQVVHFIVFSFFVGHKKLIVWKGQNKNAK